MDSGSRLGGGKYSEPLFIALCKCLVVLRGETDLVGRRIALWEVSLRSLELWTAAIRCSCALLGGKSGRSSRPASFEAGTALNPDFLASGRCIFGGDMALFSGTLPCADQDLDGE